MTRGLLTLTHGICCLLLLAGSADQLTAATYQIVESITVDQVPSWFPVGFALLTHDNQQYVAYYNEHHQLMVSRRRIDQPAWQKVALPTRIGWDSHNYVTMALDSDGQIHLSGNMHCVPLIYFRTERPGDITSFVRSKMTGQEEQRCTYPRFLTDSDDNLLFMYRSGSSGNGRRFFNRYDTTTKTWSRFLDTPIFEGEGQRNAYPRGPEKGPDGLFHMLWVWRDTPDCATNHHLSYARSPDLKHWQAADGQPVRLPLTLEQLDLCVDPIPPGGGIINGCEKLAFDAKHRPVIAYHKLDENGHMQIYVARFQQGRWQRHPVTTWNRSIVFGGRGAMPFIGIRISEWKQLAPDTFVVRYTHRDYGSGYIVLDAESLLPIEGDVQIPRDFPQELTEPTMAIPGISVRTASDLGRSGDPRTSYLLQWETLGANHDRPREPPLPPASTLKLVTLRREL